MLSFLSEQSLIVGMRVIKTEGIAGLMKVGDSPSVQLLEVVHYLIRFVIHMSV
jgi:hypothetical protein